MWPPMCGGVSVPVVCDDHSLWGPDPDRSSSGRVFGLVRNQAHTRGPAG